MNIPVNVKPEIYIEYLAHYGPEWEDYKLSDGKALSKIKQFFKSTPYRTIWFWDIDGDGYRDFLSVEVYPKIRRGIKRAILVDETGKVKLYIDTIKGVYTDDRVLLDLQKIGHKPGEVECYAIGYVENNNKYESYRNGVGISKKYIDQLKKKYSNTRITIAQIGAFSLQRFDKGLNHFGSDYLDKNASYRMSDVYLIFYDVVKNMSDIDLFTGGFQYNDAIEDKKIMLKKNREAIRKGKAFRIPEKLNESDIQKAIKIVTELGLY